jgi:two-component system sensor histidine kinase KdpD
MTGIIHALSDLAHLANASMLYLLVVIGVAVGWGSGPAILASVLAFFTFDWFFVEPRHTLTVRDPAEWLALVMFLITAGVTGQLTALLRARAEEARRREREAAALAEASWAVAARIDRDQALAEVLRRLAEVVRPEAAAVLVPDATGELAVAATQGEAGESLPDFRSGTPASLATGVGEGARATGWDGSSGRPDRDAGDQEPRSVYLPLIIEQRPLGLLYLRLRPGQAISLPERRVVQSLASQAVLVLERERLTRAATAAQALAEADRLKTALLSMVSHDFLSPLTSIKAAAGSLLQEGEALAPSTQRELLQGIEHETDRLNRMVANILALSRLEADAWRPQREPTLAAELIGAALDTFGPEENRRIAVAIDPATPEVQLDPVQMVQVLRNLLDNALKYSPPGSMVELEVAGEGDRVAIEVLDRGRGIPAGDRERIFEPFYRAPDLRETALPGVGMGLAVCRGLVEAHGGQLTAAARDGGGTVFRIELPTAE